MAKRRIMDVDQKVMEKLAKENKPKERKVDEEKGFILSQLKPIIDELGGLAITIKTETELSFTLNGNNYTLKLTKHRPKKNVWLINKTVTINLSNERTVKKGELKMYCEEIVKERLDEFEDFIIESKELSDEEFESILLGILESTIYELKNCHNHRIY